MAVRGQHQPVQIFAAPDRVAELSGFEDILGEVEVIIGVRFQKVGFLLFGRLMVLDLPCKLLDGLLDIGSFPVQKRVEFHLDQLAALGIVDLGEFFQDTFGGRQAKPVQQQDRRFFIRFRGGVMDQGVETEIQGDRAAEDGQGKEFDPLERSGSWAGSVLRLGNSFHDFGSDDLPSVKFLIGAHSIHSFPAVQGNHWINGSFCFAEEH